MKVKVRDLTIPILVSMIYNAGMVFYSRIPSLAVMLLGALFFVYIYWRIGKSFGQKETLFLCSILLVPTSTISVLGTSYSAFPLSWFHLVVILLFFHVIFTDKIRKKYFGLLFVFVCYVLILSMQTGEMFDAMKQILTITLFLLSFLIGTSLAKNPSGRLFDVAVDFYVYTAIAFGAQVFLQRFFILSTGSVIGHFVITGQGRYSYAGLMGDYSFATVYVATGCMLVLLQFLEWGSIRLLQFLLEEIWLLASMLAVTARTGLAALGVILIVYFFRNLRRIGWKLGLLLLMGVIAVPVILNELIVARVGQDLLDSSNRLEFYAKAITNIIERPVFGFGLGVNNLHEAVGMGLPHNFFLQYLLQIGVVGVVLLLLFFIEFLRKDLRKDNGCKWLFWLVVLSSMLIPDIFSSRFFYVIIVLCMLPVTRRGKDG